MSDNPGCLLGKAFEKDMEVPDFFSNFLAPQLTELELKYRRKSTQNMFRVENTATRILFPKEESSFPNGPPTNFLPLWLSPVLTSFMLHGQQRLAFFKAFLSKSFPKELSSFLPRYFKLKF